MADPKKIYPRTGDTQTIYLKNVITDPSIKVGDYTMYYKITRLADNFESFILGLVDESIFDNL